MGLMKMFPLHFQFQAGAPSHAISISLPIVSSFLHTRISETVWAISYLLSFFLKLGMLNTCKNPRIAPSHPFLTLMAFLRSVSHLDPSAS